jgi:hypothetical protein
VTGDGAGDPTGTINQLVQDPDQVFIEAIECRSLVANRFLELRKVLRGVGNESYNLGME